MPLKREIVAAWLKFKALRLARFFHAGPPAAKQHSAGKGKRSLVSRLLTLLLAGTVIMYVIGIIGLWLTSSRLIEDSLQKQALQWITEIGELGLPLHISKGKGDSSIENRIRSFPEISFMRYYD